MSRTGIPAGVQVTYSRQYRRCGKAGCVRCAAGSRGHGPYWYAKWWADGQARSCYVGKHHPTEINAGDDARGAPALLSHGAAVEPLRVRTLGEFTVWHGTTPIPPEAWNGRRAAALFKCLLSAPGHRLQREQAIELLWPEAEPGAGATNLRTTTHLLRQVLDAPQAGASHLRSEGEMLVLWPLPDGEPPEDWLDATAFGHAADTALAGQDVVACRTALAWYGGEYLPGDPYAPWAEQSRTSVRQLYLDVLLHLATLCAARGDLQEAEGCLRQVLIDEPSHEGAAATLMGLLAASGRRGEALQIYQQLATVLEEELDVAPATEIMALRARLQAQDAAPVATTIPPRSVQPARPTNLPLALTSFVGRVWEQRAVREALTAARLVTLTGPGGAGKTRLALEVAGTLVDEHPDGVWLVELAALADPALVARTVATALGVAEQAGRPMLDTLGDFLRPRWLLLVLDNCEHLTASCAELAAALLRTCPRLRLLATSREGLEVAGERTYRVPSLSVPDPDHLPALEQLSAYEAVRLFVERAQARRPELTLTATNAGIVAQICARLDGLPLAIELAAARVSSLPIEGIAARLDDRFRLLTGGPRTALPRQQTLRATLDWSYELLDAPEQVLWRRLAVFAGGWTLEAAEAICADSAVPLAAALQEARGVGYATILDLLEGLVNRSLVLLEAPAGDYPHGEARYRMLETIRQYGLEKLEAAGEQPDVRDRHLEWYVALGEQAEPQLVGRQQLTWLDRLEREHDNVRAALHWSKAHPIRAVAGLRLAGAMERFWFMRSYLYEGRRWLAELLTSGGSAPDAVRARALFGAARLAHSQGGGGRANAEEALRIYRALGDPAGAARVMILLAWSCGSWDAMEAAGQEGLALARQAAAPGVIAGALILLACTAIGQADLARARACGEESLEISRTMGDRDMQARAQQYLGEVTLRQGAYERAFAIYEEHLSLQHELGSTLGVATAHYLIGEPAFYMGETDRAVAELEAGMVLFRTMGHKEHLVDALEVSGRIAWHLGDTERAMIVLAESLALARPYGGERVAFALRDLGHIAHGQGEFARAVALHRESLGILRDVGLTVCETDSLEGLAMALGAHGQAALAAWLLGASEAAREAHGTILPPPDRAVHERFVPALRGALGEQAWTAAWTEGRGTTLEVAVARALKASAAPS